MQNTPSMMPRKRAWSLSVSGRVLLFTVVVWLGLLGGLQVVLQKVFHPTFVEMEVALLVKDLERVEAALERETKILSSMARDYASSDEVREVVLQGRADQKKTRETAVSEPGVDSAQRRELGSGPRLRATTLRTLDLDAIFLFDDSGRPLRALRPKETASNQPEYQPRSFASRFPVLASTRATGNGSFRRGLLRFGDGTLVFAAVAPIVAEGSTSSHPQMDANQQDTKWARQKPARGAASATPPPNGVAEKAAFRAELSTSRPIGNLVMLRELDEAVVKLVAEQVRLPLELSSGDPEGPAVRAAAATPLVENGTIHASAWLHDPFGTPIAHYSVTRPTSILAQGEETLTVGGIGSLAVLSVVLVLLLVLLHLSVVRPLVRLTSGIEGVRRTGDLNFRLGIHRTDEVGVLAYNFDRLLALLGERTRNLEELASTDGLTKLKNRRNILEFLEQKLVPISSEDILRGAEQKLSVLLLDVDYFKRINDTAGHAVGDRVLRQIAQTLRDALEPGQEAGRFGGEEFLVVLPGKDREGAIARAEIIREAVCDQPIQGVDWPVTVSIGVGTYMDQTAHGLVATADMNLYRAKEGGRNRVVAEEVPVSMLPAASLPPPPAFG